MPARVVNSGGKNSPKSKMKAPKVEIKAPAAPQPEAGLSIEDEMKAAIAENIQSVREFSSVDRAQFYGGQERSNLQGESVSRVRQLQEENDHLQREIMSKEKEVAECTDPLSILAEIEHRKIIIARNTGEILKIYLRNEERLKRIKHLEEANAKIQSEMMDMQGQFISTKDMEAKTKFASEFFVMKSEIERNLEEIEELSQS